MVSFFYTGGRFLRLDKYLKVSRLIKRRTLAKEFCDAGKVIVNGRVAKAGTEIKPDDEISLDFGHRIVKVKVLATPKAASAEAAKDMYEEI